MFLKSSKVKIAGALLVMMMAMLFVLQPAYAEHANGEYTIEFNILHADKKNASIAEGFWNQPATAFIQDGKIRVQTTINKHAWVTHFATSYNGSMNDAETVSVDEDADLRVTQFPIANFTDLVESNVSVKIDDIDYEHSYTMYFKFKPETLTLVKAEELPDVPEQTETSAPAEQGEIDHSADNEVESPELKPDQTTGASEQTDSSSVDPTEKVADQAKEETTETVEEPSSGQGSTAESSDGTQEEHDAAELSDVQGEVSAAENAEEETKDSPLDAADEPADDTVAEEGTSSASDLTDETEEESSKGSVFTITIVIMIVLIGIIAIVVYRMRSYKK